jgi:hypothetical protein
MRPLRFAAGLVLAVMALPVLAQGPQGTPVHVRGTVQKLAGDELVVKEKGGKDVTVTLAPNYRVSSVVRKKLSDIKEGDFVASTSVKGKDGRLRAIEVHIFPAALKGVVPELQAPWDLRPGSIMTNAIVTGFAKAPKGKTLMLKYKGNDTEMIVLPNVPIVALGQGDKSLLKKGAYVVVLGRKLPDGMITASNVTAQTGKVKPPM